MKTTFWIVLLLVLVVAAPHYAIGIAFMWGVVALLNLLIKLHDKYLL